MACDFCQKSIFESGRTWGYHQQSILGLQESARKQCTFCSGLYKDIGTCAASFSSLAFPLYFWTIRRHGGISKESQEYIVITFRPKDDSSGLPERTFYLFAEEDLEAMPSEETLGRSTDSPAALEQIRRWMDVCERTHSSCNKPRSSHSFIPTRLLDLGAPEDTSEDATAFNIRVVETKPAGLTGVKYATLSHCWGKKPFINLTPENRAHLTTRGVPWADLPKNFQQAIAVARAALGVRYIWIDSLCIVQGPQGDFHAEASLMHAVYRNSHCNLAAADSADSSGGLFRLRDPAAIVAPQYYHQHSPPPHSSNPSSSRRAASLFRHDTVYRVVAADLWDAQLLGTPIYTRGWVFQERMLSPRLVHFARAQIFWDCGALSACEAFPVSLPLPLDNAGRAAVDRHWRARLQETGGGGSGAGGSLRGQGGPLAGPADGSLEAFWRAAVRAYTACDLTSGRDKLMAVWGIAKLVRDALDEAYAVGMWEGRLEEQLAWRMETPGAALRWRPLERAPSWSWASVDGVVVVRDRTVAGGRCYRVQAHEEGREVAFETEDFGRRRPRLGGRKGSSWSEQFKAWDEERREKLEKRGSWKIKRQESGDSMDVSVGSGRQQTPGHGDLPPELKTWSLAVQGWVGVWRIVRMPAGKWTVDMPGMNDEEPLLEVFPDERLPDSVHECYFVILAASRDGVGANADEDEVEDEDEEYDDDYDEVDEAEQIEEEEVESDHEEVEMSEEVSSSEKYLGGERTRHSEEETEEYVGSPEIPQKQPLSFSGVGIIMQAALDMVEMGHFYRIGSFDFNGLGLDMLRDVERKYLLTATDWLDEANQENGHKFWLD